MLHWSIQALTLNLKYTWKISRNASDQKINFIVEVTDGNHTGKGEAAPNIRYKETPDLLSQQFQNFLGSNPEQIESAEALNNRLDELQTPNALRFAIESAWFHYQSEKTKRTIYSLLEVPPPGNIFTSYTIPIMDPADLKKFYSEYQLNRFKYIKLKIGAEEGLESIRQFCSISSQPLMIDANEAFNDVDVCIKFLSQISKYPIVFVEQPLPSSMTEEQVYLKQNTLFPLFGDESITNEGDFTLLKKMFDGINIKLMKAGGYLNAIRLLQEARQHGMKTMIGCMVETTLGISSGMNLCALADYADLDSFLLIHDEPYHLLVEHEGELKFQ